MSSHAKFSLTPQSYTNLTHLVPHPYRTKQQIYYTLQTYHMERTAKGVAKYLESFLCHKHADAPTKTYPKSFPYFPDPQYYTRLAPTTRTPYTHYRIKPETFVDNRSDELLTLAEQYGYIPGQTPEIYDNRMPLWAENADELAMPHSMYFTYKEEVLDALWDISMYWHIPTPAGYRPKSRTHAASGVLEAIGQRTLRHILLG